MQWLSINDVKRLVKQKMYQLETGSKSGDSLIYDRQQSGYVGHIEEPSHKKYQISPSVRSAPIEETLEMLNGSNKSDWRESGKGWGSDNNGW